MRLRLRVRRTLTIGLAGVVIAGLAAGCSSAPGVAYANGATRPAADTHSAKPRVKATPTVPAVPPLRVTGAPRGIAAKEGILVDATTGQVLWSKDVGQERPMASITKVMTAYLVISAGDLGRKITIPKGVLNYVAKYGAASDDLEPGEVLTADELLYGLLLQSGADAAYTLATTYGPGMTAFVAKMNATARSLGMDHTHFASPDGLPYPTEYSTYSTPADLVTLGEAAMKLPAFRSIVDQTQYHLTKADGHDAHWWYSDDSLLGSGPGSYPGALGIKTGYTDEAGHCLLFEAVRGGRTLIGVVMDDPPTGVDASEQDAARIMNWGFALKQPTPATSPSPSPSPSPTPTRFPK
jgi:D-alanyl-D-alanine carboxypeptidase (penicillin-binding protein 5/6)